jgi:hypothetical protein
MELHQVVGVATVTGRRADARGDRGAEGRTAIDFDLDSNNAKKCKLQFTFLVI